MKLQLSFSPVTQLRTDLLAVVVPEGPLAETAPAAALDSALSGFLARAVDDEQFKGKKGTQLVFHTHGKIPATRVLLLGAGPRKDLTPADSRTLAGRAVRAAPAMGAKDVAFVPAQAGEARHIAEAAALGASLGGYRFEKYLGPERRAERQVGDVTVVLDAAAQPDQAALDRALARGALVAESVALARDLVNEPASEMTPRRMAEIAADVARAAGVECTVLGPKECEKLGMGMFLAVARASAEEPRLIHLTYRPRGAAQRKVALIGKGVTFDSGGLSLKPNEGMLNMKVDMAGAAAVLASTVALARLGAPVEVHAFAACTENMPGGRAYKLGDVLRSMSGKTVEVNNTDAEGRLTLGDAITYAKKEVAPDEIIDLATLTGACMVALGPQTAGVMSNRPEVAARWLDAARAVGEDMWGLPLPEALKEMLRSEVADMKNTGERWGGALTAGLFLREFAGDTPWVHVDIAGPATTDKTDGPSAKGATGFGVATIVEYLSPRS